MTRLAKAARSCAMLCSSVLTLSSTGNIVFQVALLARMRSISPGSSNLRKIERPNSVREVTHAAAANSGLQLRQQAVQKLACGRTSLAICTHIRS